MQVVIAIQLHQMPSEILELTTEVIVALHKDQSVIALYGEVNMTAIIKLVHLLDGTLLTSDKKISQRNLKALAAARAKGKSCIDDRSVKLWNFTIDKLEQQV